MFENSILTEKSWKNKGRNCWQTNNFSRQQRKDFSQIFCYIQQFFKVLEDAYRYSRIQHKVQSLQEARFVGKRSIKRSIAKQNTSYWRFLATIIMGNLYNKDQNKQYRIKQGDEQYSPRIHGKTNPVELYFYRIN